MNIMKVSIKIFALITLILTGTLIASAQGYVPLESIPGVTQAGTSVNMSDYLSGLIKFLIAFSSAFAVLMLIVGGTEYVAAGALPSAKSEAKKRMIGAITGLIIVLVSYLILNSINPKLVQFNLMLPPVGTLPSQVTPGATATTTPIVKGGNWPDDAATRSIFNGAGIPVLGTSSGSRPCTTVGQTGCTSVYNLPSAAVNGVIALKNACGCGVTVTGGTEYWLHRSHGSATSFAPIVDLDDNPALDNYIRNTGARADNRNCGPVSAPKYTLKGAVYADEGNHWHVCY